MDAIRGMERHASVSDRGAPRLRSRIEAAMAAIQKGNPAQGLKLAGEIIKAESRNPHAHLAGAMALQQLGKIKECIAHYRACLAIDPANQLALTNLGVLMVNHRQPQEAVPLLKAALKDQPKNGHAHHFLGRAYGMLLRYGEAVVHLEIARSIFPRNGEIAAGYARALSWAGRIDEALAMYDIAEGLNPNDDNIPEGRARCLIFSGKSAEAESLLRQAIAKNPSLGGAYQQLAKLGKLTANDVAAMERETKRGSVDNLDRAQMLLAMGSFFERRSEAEEAWRAYSEAARLLDRERHYDREKAAAQTAESIAALDRLESLSAEPKASENLVFIIGMPRSGTTLIEDVLARHSRVFAGGERDALGRVRRMFAALDKQYPKDIDKLAASEMNTLRDEYLRGLPTDAKYLRFTDKVPDNAHHLALIQRLFPAATILISRRHPLDICLSVLAEGFGRQLAYATNLENIASNMIQQDRIIARWRKSFGQSAREIFYEDLVTNWEAGVRAIVEATGLAFEENCLIPEKSKRLVHTASAAQVRQPVYRSSIGRWKPFASYLAPAENMLRPLIERHQTELSRRGIVV